MKRSVREQYVESIAGEWQLQEERNHLETYI